MEKRDILSRIKNIISSIFQKPFDHDDGDFAGSGLSSRETCETIFEIENEFEVKIEDEEIPEITTPEKLAEIIIQKRTE